jgi:hypothetical protein
MTDAQMKWYVTRLSQIPNFLDRGEGETACRKIGEEINSKYGFESMVQVCENYRDKIDENRARHIEHVWEGIGRWLS